MMSWEGNPHQHRSKQDQTIISKRYNDWTSNLLGWPEPYIYRYIRCTYGIFSREITMHTVIYGADIRFWPTHVFDLNLWPPDSSLPIFLALFGSPWKRRATFDKRPKQISQWAGKERGLPTDRAGGRIWGTTNAIFFQIRTFCIKHTHVHTHSHTHTHTHNAGFPKEGFKECRYYQPRPGCWLHLPSSGTQLVSELL